VSKAEDAAPATPTTVELELELRVGGRPLALRGALTGGGLTRLAGTLRGGETDTLGGLLADLGEAFAGPGAALDALGGGALAKIHFEAVELAYRSTGTPCVSLSAVLGVGASRTRILVAKLLPAPGRAADEGGLVAGFELELEPRPIGDKGLSELIGGVVVERLGVFHASRDCSDLHLEPATVAGALAPLVEHAAGGRSLHAGLNLSGRVLIGGVDLLEGLGRDTSDTLDAQAPAATPAPTPPAAETPPAPPAASPPAASPAPEAPLPTRGKAFWKRIDKRIGPLTFRRVGLVYESSRLAIALDAGLRIGGLSFELVGFGVDCPLAALLQGPQAALKGLGVRLEGAMLGLEAGAIAISGGLTRAPGETLRLDGSLRISTPVLSVSAIGAYERIEGAHSFFAFAALHKEIGGPPFFFVTGLCLGIGIHRRLTLPPIEQVHSFPLLRAAAEPDFLGKDVDPRRIGALVDAWLAPEHDSMWIAGGVRFTSFGIVESVAMLSVAFGNRLEIGVLGLSRLQLPRKAGGEAAMACLEMELRVVIAPEDGLVAVEGRLTENSFVLRRDFRLRGGFAFFAWYAGPHAGDFVVSVGGYHPAFRVPAHYPRPERVEFNCQIGQVTISGQCYFALCPAAIMAGGSLSIVYASGGIRAWLVARADFLMQWKPLHYEASVAVSLGVQLNIKIWFVRIRLSIELGAAIALYGPPLAGSVRISLYVVSFTIGFGPPKTLPPPMVWESDDPERSFAHSFLGNPDVTRISVVDGLLDTPAAPPGSVPQRPVLQAHRLHLRCQSSVPATELFFGDAKVPPREAEAWPPLGVQPMGFGRFHSEIRVTLEALDANGCVRAGAQAELDVAPVTASVPSALWSPRPLGIDVLSGRQLIDGAPVGIELRGRVDPDTRVGPALQLETFAYDRVEYRCREVGALRPATALPGSRHGLGDTLMEAVVVERRRAIVGCLNAGRGARRLTADAELPILAAAPEHVLDVEPLMARVGQDVPRMFAEI
jgi:hypothetical protein